MNNVYEYLFLGVASFLQLKAPYSLCHAVWTSALCGTEWRSCSPDQAAAVRPARPTLVPRPVPATASGRAVSPLVLYSPASFYPHLLFTSHFQSFPEMKGNEQKL